MTSQPSNSSFSRHCSYNIFRGVVFFLFLPAALSSLLFTSCKTVGQLPLEQSLSGNWTFAESGSKDFYPASVPGTIHTDLIHNNLIPNPFDKCNEKDVQWIARKTWVYKTHFDVSSSLLKAQNLALVFEGLDTYADVRLNGHQILHTNNMFRSWEVVAKEFIQEKNNLLEIIFYPALDHYEADSAANSVYLPGGKWIYSRKAAYHFGWDWGPTLITAGIWKPVKLVGWNNLRATDWHFTTSDLTEKQARIGLNVSLESSRKQKAKISINDQKTGQEIYSQIIEIEAGTPTITNEFTIENPKLWWTNGLGEPYLYEWTIRLETADGQVISHDAAYGIRSLRLVEQDDSIGKSFYFELNGHPLFAKGVNYIPQQSFVTEVPDSSYHSLIQQAAEANMNMIRIWGGGIYETDLFYELCDRHGILVWQDFMFACAMYPGDPDFLDNVRIEAVQQIKRLRNHPCLALWCGNNEVDEAWHNWGWQKQYEMSAATQDTIWQYYTNLFRSLLPEIVATHDPSRQYVSTSPQNGWGRKESMTHADSHYWGVWWGKLPFEKYLEKVPRFMSEFGFQALPSRFLINSYDLYDGNDLLSQGLHCHQKNPQGYQTIDLYIEREKIKPRSLDEYIYASQLIQAQGIGMGIEAQHSAMPSCMGSLYWQLNDVWPVTSWSSIDSKGVWKALHYRVKELFAPLSLSIIPEGDSLKISVINDHNRPVKGKLRLLRYSFKGSSEELFANDLGIESNEVAKIKLRLHDVNKTKQAQTEMLIAEFIDNEGHSCRDFQFFAPLGELKLMPAAIETTIEEKTEGLLLSLKADVFTAFVQLSLPTAFAHFDDNFFHLFPGQTKTVLVNTQLSAKSFQEQFNILSLNNLIHNK